MFFTEEDIIENEIEGIIIENEIEEEPVRENCTEECTSNETVEQVVDNGFFSQNDYFEDQIYENDDKNNISETDTYNPYDNCWLNNITYQSDDIGDSVYCSKDNSPIFNNNINYLNESKYFSYSESYETPVTTTDCFSFSNISKQDMNNENVTHSILTIDNKTTSSSRSETSKISTSNNIKHKCKEPKNTLYKDIKNEILLQKSNIKKTDSKFEYIFDNKLNENKRSIILSSLCKFEECLNYRRFGRKKLSDFCCSNCQYRKGNIVRKKSRAVLNKEKVALRHEFEYYILKGMVGNELEEKRQELLKKLEII
jgi:hypothetical protein